MSKHDSEHAEQAGIEAWKSIIRDFCTQVEAQATEDERMTLDHTAGEKFFLEDVVGFAVAHAERFKPLLTELIQKLHTLSGEHLFDLKSSGGLSMDAHGEIVVITSESFGFAASEQNHDGTDAPPTKRVARTYRLLTGPDAGQIRTSEEAPLWDALFPDRDDNKNPSVQ